MIVLGENSWVEVADATAYLATQLYSDAWTEAGEASPPLQEAALITAHGRLMQEPGIQAADHDDPPQNLKRAQMKLALVLLDDDLLAGTGLEGFDEVRVGPVALKIRHRPSGGLPDDVRRELGDLLKSGSPLQFPILRG